MSAAEAAGVGDIVQGHNQLSTDTDYFCAACLTGYHGVQLLEDAAARPLCLERSYSCDNQETLSRLMDTCLHSAKTHCANKWNRVHSAILKAHGLYH